jgi:hypothetical protein
MNLDTNLVEAAIFRTRTSCQNAEVNIGLNEQAMVALDHFTVPAELGCILRQFRDSLAFFSTVERRRLEYLRTRNLGLLAMRIGAIDPSVECVAEIKQLENVATLSQSCKLSLYGWQNCLNSAWHRVSPQYPRQAWRRFSAGVWHHRAFCGEGSGLSRVSWCDPTLIDDFTISLIL